MKTWLILDCNYLCWRAWHSIGHLSHRGISTGVAFGFLRDLSMLQQQLDCRRPVFCFDVGKSVRTKLCPTYKNNRKGDPEVRKLVHTQLDDLRKDYLPSLGYRNLLWQRRYEADDLIASVCNGLGPNERAIIVASDHDLYQLLSAKVSIYDPHEKQIKTPAWLLKHYGVTPNTWADVKAIAGCNTDAVPGIDGIGEKTAAKFLGGRLDVKSKAHEKIVLGNSIWRNNLTLVRLPITGTEEFVLRSDKVTKKKWLALAERLGSRKLRDCVPNHLAFSES